MNHNEEMKLLGYLKKIADNTGRIADALEKMVPPVPPEVKPVTTGQKTRMPLYAGPYMTMEDDDE